MLRRILGSSRWLIVIAVVCAFIASVTVLMYGAVQTLMTVTRILASGFSETKETKTLVFSLVEIVDLFLLATVFYIISLGLYELFIDDSVNVPAWLEIHDLDDLKGKLTGVVIVILSVTFLGQAVRWNGEDNLLPFGVSVALVIASLAYFLGSRERKG